MGKYLALSWKLQQLHAFWRETVAAFFEVHVDLVNFSGSLGSKGFA